MNAAKVFGSSVPLTINSGATLASGNFQVGLGGNFTNGGTFTAGSSPVVITGTMVAQSISGFTTTGLVSMTKTAGIVTLTGNVSGAGLTINGSGGTLNLGSGLTHTFTGDVTLTTGTLNGGSSTLNENSTSATAWNGTGSLFTAGTGTVNFSGVNQTLSASATTFNNLTLSNSGAKTFSNANTVNGILSMEGVATATLTGGLIYGAAATLQYNTATSRTAGAEWLPTFPLSGSSTGGIIIANTGTITQNAAKVVNAPLTINSGATLNTSSSNYQLTLRGNFSNSGIFTANASPITFSGTATQSLSGFTTTGLVSMTKTGGTATLTGNVNGAGLTINGSGGTLNLGTGLTHTFAGDVTLTTGTLNGGSSSLNINSTSATAWGGTGSIFAAGTGTVNFGGVAQTLSASATTFNKLTFSNSGTKTFSSATTIGELFTITGSSVANLGTGLSHTAGSLTLGANGKTSGTWGGTGGLYSSVAVNYINTTYFAASTGGLSVTTSQCAAGNWTGTTSTDWNVSTNWCDGTIPTSSTNVIIPSGGNQPVISTGGGSAAYCNNLTINSGATLTINGPNRMTITNNITNNGSFIPGTESTVTLTGGNQTISGNAMTFNNLSLISFGVKTFSNAPTVNGFLYLQATATISIVPIYGPNATLQYQTTTARTAGIEWITPFTATGGVVIASSGTITLNSAKVFGASVPLYINSGSTIATNNFEVDFGGSFTNYGTFSAGSSPIVITGTMPSQSIDGFTTTGLVSMTKTAGTATFTGNVSGVGLTVNGTGGSLNLGTSLTHTFTGNWSLTAGTVLGNTSTLNIGGSGTAAGTFTANTGTVNYNASAPQTIAPLTYYNLTLSGSSTKTTTGITVSNILSMEGTATTSALPTYGGSATLQYKGSGAQTTGAEFPSTWSGTGGVKIENANGTGVTLNSVTTINNSSLTIGGSVSNSIFNDGGKQITVSGTTTLNLNSGTFKLGSATVATTFPAFSGTPTIATGTTVEYASTFAVQTVSAQTYSNLTISGTDTYNKVAGGDLTVNGTLTLSANPSSGIIGSLDMSTSYILNMGTAATSSGLGDVTGIVKRTNASFVANTPYSFGNQYTTVTFIGISGGTRPGWLSCKIAIGAAPSWKAGAVQRVYTFAEDISATDEVILNLHYLNSELQTNTATKLVFYDHDVSTADEHGKTNNDVTNMWVGLSGYPINYIATSTSMDVSHWGLADYSATKNTWLGATNSNWSVSTNWSSSNVPLATEDVLIPVVISRPYPVLTANVEVKTLEIATGASLDPATFNLTINGSTGAWHNNGTFTLGTGSSTVYFTHTSLSDIVSISGTGMNNLRNINVSATSYLQPASGSYLKIAGTVTVASGGIIDLKATNNTVEYNGSGQSIVNLQGPASDLGYANLVINSSGTETLPATLNVMRDFTLTAGTIAAAGSPVAIAIIGNVILTAGTFTTSGYAVSVGGNWTNNGATYTQSSGSLTFNNTTTAQAINGTASSQTFNDVVVDKTSQTLGVGGSTISLTVNNFTETSGNFTAPATLNINGNATLTAGTFNAGTDTNILGNWSNSSATFNAGSGTVTFNGSGTQTIGGTNTFNNLTIYKTALGKGVTATANQTVNEILYLNSPNHSSTAGALDMGVNTLYMGATATTTGTGDVTGIVTRTSFVLNTPYSFGNQFTTMNFSVGPLPTSITFKIVLTASEPAWMTTTVGVNRYYDIIRDAGTYVSTRLTLNLHYLDTECNSAPETTLDFFDDLTSGPTVTDRGRSNNNNTNNWVGLSGLGLPYVANPAYDFKYWTLGTHNTGTTSTWISGGAVLTEWTLPGNWDGGVPTSTSDVVIPAITVDAGHNNPILPTSTTINSINIQSGGTLNGGTGTTLTIAGGAGAWFNAGTFGSGTSNVVFTNAAATMADPTNFYNVTVADGASLTLGTDNTMRIAGTLSLSTSGVLNAATNHNTVEYNGTDQIVILPNGSTPGYHNLILSGSGTKTMPSSPMTVNGDFTLSGSASATASNDIAIAGNWTNSSSGSFAPGTGTVTFNSSAAQTISGVNTFNNLTIYKTTSGEGVTASANQTVNGILNLNSPNHSASKGALDMGVNTLNMGPTATTTGTGDVTGTVNRTTIIAGTTYTFGNQYTSVSFPGIGTLPTAMSLTISIGTAPGWKTGAIQRHFTMYQTGGSGTRGTLRIHYLDSEMNSNTENLLVPWTSYSNSIATEGNRSDFDMTNNFITISNVTLDFPSGTEFTLGNTLTPNYTWTGNTSTNWNTTSNWSSSVVPISTTNVIIPDAGTTSFDPSLPSTAEISTINIQNGGILNAETGAVLTLNGNSGTWNNDGIFNPNNSKVIFSNITNATLSGTTNFYDIQINSGTLLATQASSVIGIAGTVTNIGTWSLVSQGPTTVNYNGGVQTVVVPDASTNRYSTLILSGTNAKTVPSGLTIDKDFTVSGSATATATGALTINGQVTLESGTFVGGAYTHNVKGNWTNNGGAFTNTGTTINFNGTGAQTIGGTSSTTFETFKINNSAGALLGVATTTTNLSIGDVIAGSLFQDNGYQLTSTGTLNLTSGTFKLGSSTATVFPAFTMHNITAGTTVEYAATAAQTIKGVTYSNLTFSGTGTNSKIADGDITVNSILNLISANASATQGCLDMSTYSLTMGGSATTTGTGDVTGIVKRTSFALGTIYSFGNQFTTMNFIVGPLPPTEVSVKISLYGSGGVTWKPDAINRNYDIISPSADPATRLALTLHYLSSELNGNVENNLDLWDDHVGTAIHDHGRTSLNSSDGWVRFDNVGLKFMSGDNFGERYWTLGTGIYNTTCTWIGSSPSVPTDWLLPGNWQGGVPIQTSDVVIPGGLTDYPALPSGNQTINTLQLQSGAVLNSTGTPTLTISAGSGAWQNLGTFNAGSSTVLFTNAAATMSGSTNFNNITVANGASLNLGTGNSIGIAGTLSLSSTGVLNAAGSNTSVEYNGTDQTVIIPNGSPSGYYNLTLSGSDTKTMPSSPMSILGNLAMSGTASATLAQNITLSGNVSLGIGTTLNASTYTVNLAGNWSSSGTFTPGTSTVTFSGTSSTISGTTNFNNLTISSGKGLQNLANSVTRIAGTATNAGTWDAVTFGNTVEYNGTNQTVLNPNGSSAGYSSLILSSSGAKTMPGTALRIGGDFSMSGTASATAGNSITTIGSFTIGSGTTFSAGASAYQHAIGGNFLNSGTFTTAGSEIIFNGSSTQIVGGSVATTFNHLTINNTAGVTINSVNPTVNGDLTFTNGKITTGSNAMILGNAARVYGAAAGKYVFGNLQKGIAASSTTKTFEVGDATNYLPTTIAFAGTPTNGAGNITCSTTNSQQPTYSTSGLSQTKYLNRYWTVTNSGVTFGTYDATFTFVSEDIINSAASLLVKKYASGWTLPTTGTNTSTTVQSTGNSSTIFGDFVAGEPSSLGTDYYRSNVSTGNWSVASTWQSSPDNSTWVTAGSAPTNAAHSITIQSGHTITIDATATASDLYIIGTLTSGSGIGLSINGIWNNTGTFTAGTGTVTFDGTTTISGSSTNTFNNVTITGTMISPLSATMNMTGNWSNSGTFTHNSGMVNFNGSLAQTITGATTFNTLKVNNAAGVTLATAVTVINLTIGDVTTGSVFNDGGFQITGDVTGALTLSNSGTIKIGNGAGATTFPAFATYSLTSGTVEYGSSGSQTIVARNYGNLTNSGGGARTLSGIIGIAGAFTVGSGAYTTTSSTVDFNGTTAQTINGITYNNLTISGSGNNSKIAAGNITVNSILNLSSSNYSATQGALDMSTFTLDMGAATTTGTGDVTGIVRRTTSFALATDYTFGNAFTKMNFTVAPLPTSVSFKIVLTSSEPSWMTTTVGMNRYYNITRVGGSNNTHLTLTLHYLDSELNGATESSLDFFDDLASISTVTDRGQTSRDATNNYVSLSGLGLPYVANTINDFRYWTLGTNNTGNTSTWISGGATLTD